MKAIAIILIILVFALNINTQALTAKSSAKPKVSVKAGAKVATPKANVTVKAKTPSVKPTAKVSIKAKVPKVKVDLKKAGDAIVKAGKTMGDHISATAKDAGKAISGGVKKIGTKLGIKIGVKASTGGSASATATSWSKNTNKCLSKINYFGIKMLSEATVGTNMCGLKYSCCDATSFKDIATKFNNKVKNLGSWIWSQARLAKWVNFISTKLDFTKVSKLCGAPASSTPKPTDKPVSKTNRLLQALSVKAKAPKAKVAVKAKVPAVKAKVGVKASIKPKAKISIKAPNVNIDTKALGADLKKHAVKIGGAISGGIKKAGDAISKGVKSLGAKMGIKSSASAKVKVSVNGSLGSQVYKLGAEKSTMTGTQWDAAMESTNVNQCLEVLLNLP